MPVESGMPENDDVRKKALLRLAVAGIVTAAALGGLWWLDQSGSKPPPAETSPAPIVAATPPEVAAPQTETLEPEPETEPLDTVAEDAEAEEAAELAEPPPPPKVSNDLVKAPRHQASVQSGSQRSSMPLQLPAPQAAARSSAEPMQQRPASAGNVFVVQLGVFSNPDNARELVDKLKKQGIRAHLEARVQMGPFLNRQEAEKAQVEMRKLGYNALVTLPYSALPAMK